MRWRGRFFFTPTSAILRRVVFYGILMFFLIPIQTSLPFIPLFEGAVPNLVLICAGAIGFFDSERAGALAGIAAGCALDCLGGTALALMPLAGFAAGYLCGILADNILPRTIQSFSLALVGIAAMNLLLTVICAYAANSEIRPLLLSVHTLIPEFIFTVIVGVPVTLLSVFFVKIAGRTKRNRQLGEKR